MKQLLVLSGIFLLLTSCTKDSESKEEMPLFSFLSQSGTSIDTIRNGAAIWEYGFRFKPLKTGKITKLGIKVPAINTFKVKLYNLTTQTIIAQTSIQSTSEGGEFFGDIADVNVTSGADLGVAIVADVFFKVRNLNGDAFSFPITKDNLSIISFNEEICGPNGCNAFPGTTNGTVIAPCVNIVFIKD